MRAWGMIAIAWAMTGAAVAAEYRPAGLVLSYTGALPGLAPYSEVMEGATFALDKDVVSFVHYGTCKTVEVRGGSLKFPPGKFEADGTVRELAEDQCPAQMTVKASGTGGAVLLRAATVKPKVSPTLDCVLTGKKRESYASALLTDAGGVVAQFPLNAPKISLPPQTRPLRGGGSYRMTFMPRDPADSPRTLTLTVGAPSNQTPCVLRID